MLILSHVGREQRKEDLNQRGEQWPALVEA